MYLTIESGKPLYRCFAGIMMHKQCEIFSADKISTALSYPFDSLQWRINGCMWRLSGHELYQLGRKLAEFYMLLALILQHGLPHELCTESRYSISEPIKTACKLHWPNDQLIGFNGTFSTKTLHHAFDKYVTVKKIKLMRTLTVLGIHTINHYDKNNSSIWSL